MQIARIVCPGDDLNLSGKRIHGRIALRVGDVSFPAEDWTDFAVVLLGWWCASLGDLLTRKASNVRLPFMDGPYEAAVQATSQGWQVTLVERRSDERASAPEWINSSDLIDSAIEAARRVLTASVQYGWKTEDVAELARATETLSRLAYPPPRIP